jgi:hypothetical protein
MIVQVCGDCAAKLRDEHGACLVDGGKPEFGHGCDAHPGGVGPQATNVLEVEGFDPVPSTLPPPPPPPFGRAPSLLPTLSEAEIACRFLVAWSTASEGASVNELMIRRAVDVARQLLAATEGA